MKTISERNMSNGKRRVVLDLDPWDQVIAVKPDSFYELGHPMQGDVISGHILAEASQVSWCSIEQKWVT